MIFVTVGTHEQQFNRLVEEIDRLKAEGIIQTDVFIQIGFSDYRPKYCEWKRFLSYDEMNNFIKRADTIVTHGGPATFMNVIANGKIPVVVPRRKKYGEHVNDHQLEFCNRIVDEGYNLIVIDDIRNLKVNLTASSCENIKSNNKNFLNNFSVLISDLFT